MSSEPNSRGEPEFRFDRQDDRNAGGGFRFDLEVDPPLSCRERKGKGSRLSVLLQREGGIGIYDFLVSNLSENRDESLSVAHIQSLSDGSCVWVTSGFRFFHDSSTAVPETATTGAMALFDGLLFWSRFRFRRNLRMA
jgi:hypothetical protein